MGRGAVYIDLMIKNKTLLPTAINGKGTYNVLLGWGCIRANCWIPSTKHQCLIQWIEDVVQIVDTNSYFSVAAVDA